MNPQAKLALRWLVEIERRALVEGRTDLAYRCCHHMRDILLSWYLRIQ